jgi:AAA family ATP:ADP antiporter
VGSKFTAETYKAVGAYGLMLGSALVLLVCIALTWIVHKRESSRASLEKKKEAAAPLDKKGGFRLVFSHRYLLLIALLVMLLNTVNTTGGYIFDRFVTQASEAMAEAERETFIAETFGNFYFSVNLLGFLIQSFLVSRLFKWIGVRGALFILPLVAMGGYTALLIFPVLAIVRTAKILENATDYSLNNTVRHALYLPTTREAKYKAKAVTDTFFVRFGDMLQAGIVYVGTTMLAFTVQQFAIIILVLVGMWLLMAAQIHREHKRLAAEA